VGEPLGVGIVGAGAISGQYLATLEQLSTLQLVAVADADASRAAAAAAGRDRVTAHTVPELLARPDVDVVVNLTPPAGHAEVALAAVRAGKAVYNEKPLAATVELGRDVLRAAELAGARVGGAPDTVLGTGVQTARQALDTGLIGEPTAAVGTFLCPGHEAWHENPDYYYASGGGPLLDMGPYYVTALVTLLGPVVSVVGASNRPRQTRTIATGPRAGQTVPVSVDTHVSALLTHASGAVTTLTTSFDAVATQAAKLEVHGPEGTLSVPDPNYFTGQVRHFPLGGEGWSDLPVSAGYTTGGRGLGVAELMASADPVACRTSGTLALHVLDVLESVLLSAEQGRAREIRCTVERPAAVPLSTEPGAT
jgi:predicted dehydrogenase